MVKLSKFYIAIACTALCLFGCGGEKEIPKEESVPVQDVKKEEVDSKEELLEEEKVYHAIKKGAVDYLSVKGIPLEPGTEIAMVATDSGNRFWNDVKRGAQRAISDLNQELGYSGKNKISLTFAAPKNEDVVEQINIIDQFLDKAPDALCIAFTDATACKTQMQMAKNNGIHLVAFDTPDEDLLTDSLVGTNNKKATAEAAAKMFEAIDYEGKVAIIVHSAVSQTGMDRKQAIVDELTNNYNDKNIQFADIVYLLQENRKEKEILGELLERNPDLAGIICTNLRTTEMVIDYVNGLETSDVKVIGFDVSEKIIQAVKDGTIVGTMSQDPFGMGYATVTTAARSIAGIAKASTVYSDHQWIDLSNLQSEEVQSILNF